MQIDNTERILDLKTEIERIEEKLKKKKSKREKKFLKKEKSLDKSLKHREEMKELDDLLSNLELFTKNILTNKNLDSQEKITLLKREIYRFNPFNLEDGNKIYFKPLPALLKRKEILDNLKKNNVIIIEGRKIIFPFTFFHILFL